MGTYFVRFLKDGKIVAQMFVESSQDSAIDDADLILSLHHPDLEYDDADAVEVDETYIHDA